MIIAIVIMVLLLILVIIMTIMMIMITEACVEQAPEAGQPHLRLPGGREGRSLAVSQRRGEVLLRGVGTAINKRTTKNKQTITLNGYFPPPDVAAQWQPDALTVRAREWFLGAGLLGAPPVSLSVSRGRGA